MCAAALALADCLPGEPLHNLTPPAGWVGVIGTGQSLAVGYDPAGSVFFSTTQPFGNLMLRDTGAVPRYPIVASSTAKWQAVPLVEPIRATVPGNGAGYTDNQYPNDLYGETGHCSFANTLSQLWQERGNVGDFITAHTLVGMSAAPLSQINKEGGFRAYPASLNEAAAFAALAKAAGTTYAASALLLEHGEADATNPAYGAGLWQLWQDYAADLAATTGQTAPPIIFASQQSAVVGGPDGSAMQLWQQSLLHPGQIVCVGPRDAYGYAQDLLHLPAAGYMRLREKQAQVYDLIVNQRVAWKPLQPRGAYLHGSVVYVELDVPVLPLVWDPNVPAPHTSPINSPYYNQWKNGLGFEVRDAAGNPLTISAIQAIGNTVLIQLSATPTLPISVANAITADQPGFNGGSQYGLIGTLRDSDAFQGYDAETVTCNVTHGSATVTPVAPGGLIRRTKYDVVTGAALAAGTAIVNADNWQGPASVTLSNPWTGASGAAALSYAYDMHNWLVHFYLQVTN